MDSSTDTTYVVFEGRKPGMYHSWPLSKLQVNDHTSNNPKKYNTFEEAKTAWINYCMNQGFDLVFIQAGIPKPKKKKPEICSSTAMSSSSSNPGVWLKNLAPAMDSNKFILHYDVQDSLKQACYYFGIPEPSYCLHDLKMVDECYLSRRYIASISLSDFGKELVAVGRFGLSFLDAMEDVAAKLLCQLLETTGKKIRDYNYYNAKMLVEEQLQKALDEKRELEMALDMMKKFSLTP